MLYRRGSSRSRRYPVTNALTGAGKPVPSNTTGKVIDIPLPNTSEPSPGKLEKRNRRSKLPFPASLINSIRLDDLILIGLIILLLDENVEDDFLLIILLYIFVADFIF